MVKFAVEFWWKMLLTISICPRKRSSKISFQTSPEVRHQFRRKLHQLHSGNRWCLTFDRSSNSPFAMFPSFDQSLLSAYEPFKETHRYSHCYSFNSDLSDFDRIWDRKTQTKIDRPAVHGTPRSGSRPPISYVAHTPLVQNSYYKNGV